MLCDDKLLVYFDFEMWLHTVYCCQLPLQPLDTSLVALALARFMSGGNGQESCDLSFGVREVFWVFHDRPVLPLGSGWSGGFFCFLHAF